MEDLGFQGHRIHSGLEITDFLKSNESSKEEPLQEKEREKERDEVSIVVQGAHPHFTPHH